MSLIQEALEKASKPQTTHSVIASTGANAPVQQSGFNKNAVIASEAKQSRSGIASVAQPAQPASQRVEKIKERSIFFQAANPKLRAKIQLSPQVLIRISVVAGISLLFCAVAALLSRTGKSGAIMSGVSVAASQSSILPLSDAETTKFVLTGITDSGNSKLALINNQVVAVGDRLQEKAFVKEIHDRTVVLDYNHKEIKLSL